MKEKIIKQLINNFQNELSSAKASFKTASSYRYEDDMKQEGKYDTRAIEAGYLAGAQQKRVSEIEHDLKLLEEIDLELSNSIHEVMTGSLVKLEHNGMIRDYFISSTSGGSILQVDGNPILVISIFSPLGRELINCKKGEELEVEINGSERSYKVIDVR